MKAPLGARLEVPGRRPVEVSHILDGFSFRRTAPGGFAGAQGKLWASIEEYGIGPLTKLVITDGRTAETLWEGYLDSPGDSFDDTGEAFELNAQGAQTLVSDKADPLLYLDTSMENWRADDRNDERLSDSSQAEASAWPDTEREALMLSFAAGSPIAKGSEARMVHDLCENAPMGIGGYSFTVKSGINSNGYSPRITLSNNGPPVETIDMQTSTYDAAGIIGYNVDNAGDILKIRLRRTAGATNIATDRIWTGFADPVVVGNRLFRDGTSQLASTPLADINVTRVRAHEVVEDLVARMMPMVDPNRVYIEHGKFDIDQLTYADPARAAGVLEDMELFEPDMVWLVGPSGDDGRYSFSYRDWPAAPRYEISISDGYSAPGENSSLCNRVAIGWTDRKGQQRTTIVTQNVPELGGRPDDPGARTVDAEKLDLDESVSSYSNAQQIGKQLLRLTNNPPTAATATVVRPIWDRRQGCTVAPWEIEPGYLVRLRETGENLRLTEVEVNTDEQSAALTLGEPAPTQEQLIARLTKPKRRRRR